MVKNKNYMQNIEVKTIMIFLFASITVAKNLR